MTEPASLAQAQSIVEKVFLHAGIRARRIQIREYPQETIFIVEVPAWDFAEAAQVGTQADHQLHAIGFDGFVTVRKDGSSGGGTTQSLAKGVNDPRAVELVKLLVARSRASESQPSLSYVPDVSANLASVVTARHHLIFGRRGAGKTALMAEAKRLIEEQGNLSIWVNVQTHRQDPYLRMFLWIAKQICELVENPSKGRQIALGTLEKSKQMSLDVADLLGGLEVREQAIKRLVPRIQELLRRFLLEAGSRLYIFLDDFHYLAKGDQPALLDIVHGAVRDSDAWLKVASIKHLSRWFQASPPLGLQTGHDADHIDLDVTLEDPRRAKSFLEEMLRRYAGHENIPGITGLFDPRALDRLVLASGAVPRDYLGLCARSIETAKAREKAKQVGIQDVNRAAGDRAKLKISELEDDAASTAGSTELILGGLQKVRTFCLDEKQYTFFRIDFKDKERHSTEYAVLSGLMDVRLIHLINPSVSDEHKAGERAEVYMFDLSQFSGQRLKKRLRVLDFVRGHIVFRETGQQGTDRIGDSGRRLLAILRRGPMFGLNRLTE